MPKSSFDSLEYGNVIPGHPYHLDRRLCCNVTFMLDHESLLGAKEGGTRQPDFSLFGQSGSKVTLQLRAGLPIITKSAPEGKESRLLAQYEKQRDFQITPGIRIPRIVDKWSNGSFSMEYVSSVTLGTYSQSASHLRWKIVADSIVEFLRRNMEESIVDGKCVGDQEGFQAKVLSLRKKIELPKDSAQAHSLDELTSLSRQLPLRSAPNHGDLSFENILVSTRDSSVWFVDFLDSPIETPLLDAGRLLIDSEHGWWFSGPRPSATEEIAASYLSSQIRKLFATFDVYAEELDFFKVFAALRILPYTSAPVRRAKLLSILNLRVR